MAKEIKIGNDKQPAPLVESNVPMKDAVQRVARYLFPDAFRQGFWVRVRPCRLNTVEARSDTR